jgi:hypothetical protein
LPADSIQKTYAYGNFQWHLGVEIPFSEIGAASHGEEKAGKSNPNISK